MAVFASFAFASFLHTGFVAKITEIIHGGAGFKTAHTNYRSYLPGFALVSRAFCNSVCVTWHLPNVNHSTISFLPQVRQWNTAFLSCVHSFTSTYRDPQLRHNITETYSIKSLFFIVFLQQ